MSDVLEIVPTDPSLAKELSIALAKGAAETAVSMVGAVLILAATGAVIGAVQKRKAKKSAKTVVTA